MRIRNSIIFISVVSLLWSGCANQVQLTGGEKDVTPPQVDTSLSTANLQLRYYPQEIKLEFDEFINLRSPAKNIAISPPLQLGMDVKHRGKKVTITFDEEETLKDKATYIINFGDAITDFTEGNQLKNYSFVFSTGDFIDSLTLKGKALDAFTKEPVENMTVMLYDNVEDSVVYKEKPFYFTKTEKDGTFQFQNLRGDTFKVAGINDLNLNYLYDEGAEKFAFLDDVVIVDTTEQDLTLLAFQSESAPRYQDGELFHDGLAILKFDQNLETNPATLIGNVDHYMELDNKNVRAYIGDIDYFPLKYEIKQDTILDTILIRKPQAKDRKQLPLLKLSGSNVDDNVGLHPSDTLMVEFNFPLDSLNYGVLKMEESDIYIDSINRRVVRVIDQWEEGGDYSLSLDSNSVIDFYGRALDSTGLDFEIGRKNAFGSIEVSFEKIDSGENFVVTFRDLDEKEMRTILVNESTPPVTLSDLVPGTYGVKVIMDSNADGKWNTGNYQLKKQPENIVSFKMEPLESNRTNKEIIDFSNIFTPLDTVDISIIEIEK